MGFFFTGILHFTGILRNVSFIRQCSFIVYFLIYTFFTCVKINSLIITSCNIMFKVDALFPVPLQCVF